MRSAPARRALRVLRACAGGQQACVCEQPVMRCACCGGPRALPEAGPAVVGEPSVEADVVRASREAMVSARIRNMSSPPVEALAARDARLTQVAQARTYLAASAQKYL